MNNKELIGLSLRAIGNKPIAFNPILAKVLGGINNALLYQQLFYWCDKGSREDGWFYKTKEDIEEETCLSRYQQDSARNYLVKLGVIKTKIKKANGAPTIHYKLDDICFGKVENLLMEKRETSDSEKRETSDSLTESTQENTTSSASPKKETFSKHPNGKEVNKKKIKFVPDQPDITRSRPKIGKKHLELAGAYIKYRKFKYSSEPERLQAIARYSKPASKLLSFGYSGREILDCMKWCEKNYDEWSLETVVKKIAEYKLLNKNA